MSRVNERWTLIKWSVMGGHLSSGHQRVNSCYVVSEWAILIQWSVGWTVIKC